MFTIRISKIQSHRDKRFYFKVSKVRIIGRCAEDFVNPKMIIKDFFLFHSYILCFVCVKQTSQEDVSFTLTKEDV